MSALRHAVRLRHLCRPPFDLPHLVLWLTTQAPAIWHSRIAAGTEARSGSVTPRAGLLVARGEVS
jgi:hypothetical protein